MSYPCISPYVEAYSEVNKKVSVFNKKTGKTYLLGDMEYDILRSLDGTKSLSELAAYSRGLNEQQLTLLIDQFERIGFIRGKEPKSKLNIIKLRKGLVNGNRLINSHNIAWRIVNIIIIYLSLPLFILGCHIAARNINIVAVILANNLMTPRAFILIPFMLFMLLLHELGHAVVARCNGVNVPEIGVMLYWFTPCAYTNLSGITFLKSRGRRLIVLMAGSFTNFMLSGICLLLLEVVPAGMYEFLLWCAVSNLSIIIMNMVFFIKLDGYFILEELMEVKNLRRSAFTYMTASLKRALSSLGRAGRGRRYKGRYLDIGSRSALDNSVYIYYTVLSGIYVLIIITALVLGIYNFFTR